MSSAQAKLMTLAANDAPETFFTAHQWVTRCFKDLERRATTRELPAAECGLYGVDRALALRPGALVVIAALTSVGKSALANQVGIGVAERGGYVLISSLEMTIDQISRRFVANRANVNMAKLDYPHTFEPHEWSRVHAALSKFNDLRLPIWTESGLTISELSMRVMREHALDPLSLLIVDYLQLVTAEGENRNIRTGNVSSGLKALAIRLNIPVLALSQFNRAAADGEPKISQLRDSGSIEQDADCVGLLFRKDEKDPTLTLQFQKNRHGPLTETEMRFNGALQMFED
jgi:replicative DNA helicase